MQFGVLVPFTLALSPVSDSEPLNIIYVLLLVASSTLLIAALSAHGAASTIFAVTLPLALSATTLTLLLMAGFSVGPGAANADTTGAAGAFVAAAVAFASSLFLVAVTSTGLSTGNDTKCGPG